MAKVTASVTSSGFDVAADIERVRGLVSTLPAALAARVADTAATAITDEVVAVRGTLSVSGLGATLGVTATPGDGGVQLAATPVGAWSLVNDGSKAHRITVRRRRALTASPYGLFARVSHPGTLGDGSWDRATQAAEPVIDEAVRSACDAIVAPTGGV